MSRRFTDGFVCDIIKACGIVLVSVSSVVIFLMIVRVFLG